MAEVLGRGTIEIVADARKLRAGIEEAKKSIRTLGEGQKDISKAASASIDNYIGKLNQQNAAVGKSRRETELLKLAMRGASNEQINAADSALKVAEAHERNAKVMGQVATGLRLVATAAAAAAAAMAAAALHNIDFLDKLNDLSKSTGIAVEDLAGLSLLAKQTGTDLDGLAKGINKMSVELGKNPEKFRALGITAKDSMGAFKQLADVFNQLEDVQQRNALAQKIFSKSWQELAPALSEGSKGIETAVEKGKRLSGITTDMAKAADEFNDKLEELKITSAAFGAEFIPILTKIVEWLTSAKEKTGEWIAAFKGFANAKEEMADIERRLKKLKAERDEIASRGPIGQFFSFSADNKRQITEFEKRLEELKGPAQEIGPHLRPGEDDAAQAAAAAAAKAAAARASAFLAEDGAAGAQAKARLALDIERIRARGAAEIDAFANASKIMEAMRAANLVDDKDYYASKQAFIQLNAQASERALEAEIARLQKETFAGKTAVQDRLANQKAIVDAQAKLAKSRADSANAATVTAIQETAANEKLAQSYREVVGAANAYIDAISKRNQRELAGIGQGSKARGIQAGRDEINDRFTAAQQALERQRDRGEINEETFNKYLAKAEDTYRKEVDLYNQRTVAIAEAEGNWVNGAKEALATYADEAKNVAKQTEELFTKAFNSIEDALLEFSKTGKLNFKALANSILEDMARMSIKQNITGPLAEWLKGVVGEGGGVMNIFAKGRDGVGGAAGAAEGAAGAAGKATAGAAFTTEVTAAATAFTTEVTASGVSFTTEATASGVAFGSEVTVAATTFAGLVEGASTAFAASVATASATSAGASAAGGIASAGSYASGTSYVPHTGLYQLHQGERVVPASENNNQGAVVIHMPVNFNGPQDQRSVSQGLAKAGRMLRREVMRGTAA